MTNATIFDMFSASGEFRMVRVMEMAHPWDEYLRYILAPGASPIQEQVWFSEGILALHYII
jgi:hypothetical protein